MNTAPKMPKILTTLLMALPAILATIQGYSFFKHLQPGSWPTSDWLISYEAGPIRRGLTGQILRKAANLLPTLDIVEISFVLTATAALATSIYIANRTQDMGLLERVAISWSPYLYGVFWLFDAPGGGRKDVLAIGIILIISLSAEKGGEFHKRIATFIYAAVLPLLTLAHEAVFFFATPFLVLSMIFSTFKQTEARPSLTEMRSSATKVALASIPSLVVIVFVAIHAIPDASNVDKICQSWREIYPSLFCKPLPASLGAMVSTDSFAEAIHARYQTLPIYKEWFTVIGYLLVLTASCLAPVISDSTKKVSKSNKETYSAIALITPIWAVTLFSAVFTIPLYALAIDYGRWMSVYITSLVTFIIGHRLYIARMCSFLLEPNVTTSLSSAITRIARQRYWIVAPLLFTASYTVPHCCMELFVYKGFADKISVLIRVLAGNH